MSEKLPFNENNSGELPASEEELHTLFDRLVFYVEQHGVRDRASELDDDARRQWAKEYNDYLQDPVGTGAKLIAAGKEEKLAEFEELKAEDDEIKDILSSNIDIQGEENIPNIDKLWNWAATNPDKSEYFKLSTFNSDMIREAGMPDEIGGVQIFVEDNAQNPSDLYAKTVLVRFLYKEDLGTVRRLPGAADIAKIIRHELIFKHARASWNIDKSVPDKFVFRRVHNNYRSGIPRTSAEIISQIEADEKLGINKVQQQEVVWVNNLLNLDSQHHQTSEFFTNTVEFKEKTVASRLQNALTGLQQDKNRLLQKIVGPDTWSIYKDYVTEAALAQSALSEEAIVASELEFERELDQAKDSEYEQLLIEQARANKPEEVLDVESVDWDLSETIDAITKLPKDIKGFTGLEIQSTTDEIGSINIDSVSLAFRGNFQDKFIFMSVRLNSDGETIMAKSRTEGMDKDAWEQLRAILDKYPHKFPEEPNPELEAALEQAPSWDLMATTLKDILDVEANQQLFNNVIEGIEDSRRTLQQWLSAPDFDRDSLQQIMEELHIW
jgi:hypothetical protein